MAGRYLLTGTQLGLLLGLAKAKKYDSIEKELNSIIENQFINQSSRDLKEDIETTKIIFEVLNHGS